MNAIDNIFSVVSETQHFIEDLKRVPPTEDGDSGQQCDASLKSSSTLHGWCKIFSKVLSSTESITHE